jgi:lysophospholipase L1-like esterase
VEEGQPSRTTLRDDPIEGGHKNGLRALPISLDSHMPIDLVVLMLGTNDLKQRFMASSSDIADSVEVLAKAVQASEAGPGGAAPAVLIVAPPPILEVDWLGEMFVGGAAKSLELGARLAAAAARCGASFLDAGMLVEASAVDGIHLGAESHRALGMAVARAVEELFPPESGRGAATSSSGIRAPPRRAVGGRPEPRLDTSP